MNVIEMPIDFLPEIEILVTQQVELVPKNLLRPANDVMARRWKALVEQFAERRKFCLIEKEIPMPRGS